ncbi:PREDICTED: single-strand selective monofunctional uracil DNA glycosylase-like [Priapulus caudatus]|uniref:Single-strand selective monofunctional uracil DNA glycosylase-like n=1 Tax=Priapulus caudatus TaxID=37621 RepID=A0ABM1ETQ5_PRICU|nr:PREDICTED: single-strand selective monofunctional uracil DNA glycosylase-like [Priapulus caudatus]
MAYRLANDMCAPQQFPIPMLHSHAAAAAAAADAAPDGVSELEMRYRKRQRVSDDGAFAGLQHPPPWRECDPMSAAGAGNFANTLQHAYSGLWTNTQISPIFYPRTLDTYYDQSASAAVMSASNFLNGPSFAPMKSEESLYNRAAAAASVTDCALEQGDDGRGKTHGGHSRATAGYLPPGVVSAPAANTAAAPTPFSWAPPPPPIDINMQFLQIERELCALLRPLTFSEPVTHVYNPLEYAHQPHSDYVMKYLQGPKRVMFLGMNPGPYGMAQNGVPFGDGNHVRDWLKVQGEVYKPRPEHPNRPIVGLACTRSEVSGSRFWGFFKEKCHTPDAFFRHCFVHNYCPLAFMSKTGKNITPPQFCISQRKSLQEICGGALCRTIALLQVETVVAIGKYVEAQTRAALRDAGMEHTVRLARIMHPSPINPNANKGWADVVTAQLEELDLMKYLTPPPPQHDGE